MEDPPPPCSSDEESSDTIVIEQEEILPTIPINAFTPEPESTPAPNLSPPARSSKPGLLKRHASRTPEAGPAQTPNIDESNIGESNMSVEKSNMDKFSVGRPTTRVTMKLRSQEHPSDTSAAAARVPSGLASTAVGMASPAGSDVCARPHSEKGPGATEKGPGAKWLESPAPSGGQRPASVQLFTNESSTTASVPFATVPAIAPTAGRDKNGRAAENGVAEDPQQSKKVKVVLNTGVSYLAAPQASSEQSAKRLHELLKKNSLFEKLFRQFRFSCSGCRLPVVTSQLSRVGRHIEEFMDFGNFECVHAVVTMAPFARTPKLMMCNFNRGLVLDGEKLAKLSPNQVSQMRELWRHVSSYVVRYLVTQSKGYDAVVEQLLLNTGSGNAVPTVDSAASVEGFSHVRLRRILCACISGVLCQELPWLRSFILNDPAAEQEWAFKIQRFQETCSYDSQFQSLVREETISIEGKCVWVDPAMKRPLARQSQLLCRVAGASITNKQAKSHLMITDTERVALFEATHPVITGNQLIEMLMKADID
ncbi:hypothetical protein GNI_084450 [Gregarina niphandrodes]|uniref:Uncharacterized protein n=1 Tax=Gregarina niphandrodes TaxID=110365 RepID=A0A023B6C2_GRENI|nr:hypothetical protein GNI_084450 [Gregarina niphandrodes]EZG65037.1 hypothetical protein GNI_084450 [Gregarina niphandrodes]|eukprot:XP_011134113.1 hypothetical protein GNI_084450 [Gregarina niphandrodes]